MWGRESGHVGDTGTFSLNICAALPSCPLAATHFPPSLAVPGPRPLPTLSGVIAPLPSVGEHGGGEGLVKAGFPPHPLGFLSRGRGGLGDSKDLHVLRMSQRIYMLPVQG